MKYFVDTSFWCALYDVKDENHQNAGALWKTMAGLPVRLFTSDYVFDETVTIIKKRINHRAAVELGEAMQASKVVTVLAVTPDIREEGWKLFKDHTDKGFSFTDCTSFLLMKANGLSRVLAFDRHFVQMGFEMFPGP